MVPLDFLAVLDIDKREKQMIYRMRSNLNKEIYGGHKLDNHKSRRRKERRQRAKKSGPKAPSTTNEITRQGPVYVLQPQPEFASNSLTTLFSHLEQYWYEEGGT